MSQIEDGVTGDKVRVDGSFRLKTFGIVETVDDFAVKGGDAYNINTGLIAYTGTAASSVFYIKNNESRDLVITNLVLGLGIVSATITDDTLFTLIRNPTGGDVISDATAVGANANLNHGSAKSLTADVFNGKNGGTITGGTDLGYFYLKAQSTRSIVTLPIRIPNGQSLGVKLDLNTSGGANAYFACRAHLHDDTQV